MDGVSLAKLALVSNPKELAVSRHNSSNKHERAATLSVNVGGQSLELYDLSLITKGIVNDAATSLKFPEGYGQIYHHIWCVSSKYQQSTVPPAAT